MRTLFTGLTLLVLWTGAALAQNAPDMTSPADNVQSPTETTKTFDGPSVSVTKTQRTIDSNGVESNSTRTYDEHQTFSSGQGALSATTSTSTGGQSTVSVPPPTVITKTTRTTTEETTQ